MIGIGSTLSERGLSLTAHPVSYCSGKPWLGVAR
jgi:hypothetical protein